MKVSVVIPTYKRPHFLQQCLIALAHQDLDRADFEVVIADDEPNTATQSLVSKLAQQTALNMRYVAVSGSSHGPAAARNQGWHKASADLIAFTDDDCIPTPTWLTTAIQRFMENPELIFASGRLIMPLSCNPTDYERNASLLAKAEFVTANFFCRRKALVAIGGFDERFKLAWREDSDLFFNLLRYTNHHGGDFTHLSQAVVIHPIRPAPWGISLSQQKKNLFNALLYKNHPKEYRQYIRPSTPWNYYLTIAAGSIALLSFTIGTNLLGWFAFATWSALTIRFCIQRLAGTKKNFDHISEMIFTSVLIPPLAIFWRLRGAVRYRVWFF